ncbi:MAG: c-type cytochrome [Pseudomonadales bacterium]|nr:c-type cytochrome [Pseudomonadales bacterium]
MGYYRSLLLFFVVLTLSACDPQTRGFRLPAGDVEAGRATFQALACADCHSVADIKRSESNETDLDIVLGGTVTRVRTYGELVTSIINPSHKIVRQNPAQKVDVDAKSLMRNYNDHMTVQQLVDLVTFLESEYELYLPPRGW